MNLPVNTYVLIMAGGKGSRFWPLSRESRPKQLLAVTGDQPMIRLTVDRILPIVPAERILVITGEAHQQAITDLLPDLPSENIIAEPVGRNTAPCIGLGARLIKARCPDGVMVVLPADHLITRTAEFRRLIGQAVEMARDGSFLVTLGISPDRPETGYGYIEASAEPVGTSGIDAHRVLNFHEKPDRETAESYLSTGRFYWNSGMFIWRVDVILGWLEQLLPALYRDLERIAAEFHSPRFAGVMEAQYPNLQAVSIDFGVMEKADDVLVLPADIGWTDIGSWTVAREHWPLRDGNAVSGSAVLVDSKDCAVYSQAGRVIALVGVRDLVVVDTEDAVLICQADRDQDVRRVVDALEKMGRKDLL